MSGRTFGVQSSWDDVFKTLGLEISPKQQRKAASIADSMNQQIEEHINRYAVSASNDKGDLSFDATGTYTFNGDMYVSGTLQVDGGRVQFGDTLPYIFFEGTNTFGWQGETYAAMQLPTGHADEEIPGAVLTGVSSFDGSASVLIAGPDLGVNSGVPFLALASDTATMQDLTHLYSPDTLKLTGNPITFNTGDLQSGGGQFKGINGSDSTPSYSFTTDPTTGIYRPAASEIGVVLGGTEYFRFESEGFRTLNKQIRIQNSGSGLGSWLNTDTDENLFLYAGGMNTTSKITPGVVFGSTDGNFTTENPKALAGIYGIASQTYSADNTGGMYIEFIINANTPGTANVVNTSSHGYLMQTSGFKPRNDDVADCGDSGNRWDDVYATNGSIQTSDLREKTIVPGEELGLNFLLDLEGYAFIRDGGTRIHHGIGAQDVIAALGDDARQHAIWIQGEDGRLGVRYDELWGPQINANHELDRRLRALEDAIMGS